MLKAITKFIAEKASLTVGDDLHYGHRPQDAPDNCDVTLESIGAKPYFDLRNKFDKPIQVISRGTTYETARNRAWNIYNAIVGDFAYGSAGWTLPVVDAGEEYEAQTIEANTDPQYIGQDEKGRYEFSVTYMFRIKDLNK